MKTIALLAMVFCFVTVNAQKDTLADTFGFEKIQVSLQKKTATAITPVVVAIVDDGFNFDHQDLKGFLYSNEEEIAGNFVDDDNNGAVDDKNGWDVADNNNSVAIPKGREDFFYHGTFVTSIITNIAKMHYGNKATDLVKILPIKILSDDAQSSSYINGFKGLEYAVKCNVDIICVAWNGGFETPEKRNLLAKARQKGILIISSAGNFNSDVLYPASSPDVLCVSAVNHKFKKEVNANYGQFVDISAFGSQILGAHPISENAYIRKNGTSAACAQVVAGATIIKGYDPSLKPAEITEIIRNTATPFEIATNYSGSLGSGYLNIAAALAYMATGQPQKANMLVSKGTVNFRKQGANLVSLLPKGNYKGFELLFDVTRVKHPDKSLVQVQRGDSIIQRYSLSALPKKMFVKGDALQVLLVQNKLRKQDVFKVNFTAIPIDSATLYCEGTTYLTGSSGTLTDGSDDQNYSHSCDCKWIIKAPEGTKIFLDFRAMNTEANVDFVRIFDGNQTIKSNELARFSGTNKPPILISRSNTVLVWFVTDSKTSAKGWSLNYKVIE